MALRDRVGRLLLGHSEQPVATALEAGPIVISRVDDAVFFVDDLFRQTFGDPTPTIPTHYVAFHRVAPDRFAAVGYYHVSFSGEYALVGGLCVDARMRKRRIGEMLENRAFQDAGTTKAYFAHVGDPTRARRLGYVDTGHPHLVVCWLVMLPEEDRARLIAEVAAIGPF
jgi:hypothetical protein